MNVQNEATGQGVPVKSMSTRGWWLAMKVRPRISRFMRSMHAVTACSPSSSMSLRSVDRKLDALSWYIWWAWWNWQAWDENKCRFGKFPSWDKLGEAERSRKNNKNQNMNWWIRKRTYDWKFHQEGLVRKVEEKDLEAFARATGACRESCSFFNPLGDQIRWVVMNRGSGSSTESVFGHIDSICICIDRFLIKAL